MEIIVVTLVEEQMSPWKVALEEAYNDDKLNTFKPHHISVTSFKTPYENEVPLTAHMCKVANISPKPFKSLLPPSGDVNTDDIIDRESYPSPQVAAIQPAEEPATTADITQSINASESAEEIKSMGDALFDEFGGADANLDANESPFDTELEIKFIGKEVPKFIYIGSQVNEGDTQGTGLSIFDQIIKDSIKQALPKFDKRVKKTLNAEIPELLIKPLNNDFNLLNKKEDNQDKTKKRKKTTEMARIDNAKDCRVVPRNVNPVNVRNPTHARGACYKCGSTVHIKPACPRLNRAQGPGGNLPNQVVANNGGQGRGNQGNQARGRHSCWEQMKLARIQTL
ncbi:hypothetical protein Tco_0775039 [Tanacetum coccineum]